MVLWKSDCVLQAGQRWPGVKRAYLLDGDGVSEPSILDRALDKTLERIEEAQSIDEKAHALRKAVSTELDAASLGTYRMHIQRLGQDRTVTDELVVVHMRRLGARRQVLRRDVVELVIRRRIPIQLDLATR